MKQSGEHNLNEVVRLRIVFMGSPDFAVPALEKIQESDAIIVEAVVTQPDRKKGRGQQIQSTPVKKAAIKMGLTVYEEEDVNNELFLAKLDSMKLDAIVVVAFGQKLSEHLLKTPQLGCINLHASLLPEYRGASPIHRAIIDGKKETGVTIMFMDEGWDTGDIISQKKVPIKTIDTAGALHDRLARIGSELLVNTLKKMDSGDYRRQKQDDSKANYAKKLDKETGKIDWSDSAETIYNLVRGLNPWPVAYTFFQGKRFKIWQVEIVDKAKKIDSPGTVLEASADGLKVQTGEGIIAVKQLQPSGSKKMNYRDFLHGYQLETGHQFGEKKGRK